MQTLRTPDDRFSDLPAFPYEPHYVEVDDGDGGKLRVHYLDEGPAEAPPVLLMHGEPSWSFLYRHMLPVLVAAGSRCIVPDLVGFGRSDKPTDPNDYSYARHVDWMSQALFDRLDLRDITFFGQDWGGLVGLRLLASQPDRFARVVVGNTGLPTGDGPLSDAFMAWQKFSKESPKFDVGQIINGGTTTDLSPEIIAAYNAPFPDDTYKAGARIFPSLVPTRADDPASADNVAAWSVLDRFDRPFLCAFSDKDAITKGGDRVFLRRVPGTAGQPHTTIEGGGHFLQEDRGPELARVIVGFVAANQQLMATQRHEMRIHRSAADVWQVVGRPELLHLWFPGIVDCTVDGTTRIITTGVGLPMPEEIITNDSLQRRFQYRITAPMFRQHLATLDVIDLGDDTCLTIYSTDADPAVMALVIGGATMDALEELRRQFESGAGPALDAVAASQRVGD